MTQDKKSPAPSAVHISVQPDGYVVEVADISDLPAAVDAVAAIVGLAPEAPGLFSPGICEAAKATRALFDDPIFQSAYAEFEGQAEQRAAIERLIGPDDDDEDDLDLNLDSFVPPDGDSDVVRALERGRSDPDFSHGVSVSQRHRLH